MRQKACERLQAIRITQTKSFLTIGAMCFLWFWDFVCKSVMNDSHVEFASPLLEAFLMPSISTDEESFRLSIGLHLFWMSSSVLGRSGRPQDPLVMVNRGCVSTFVFYLSTCQIADAQLCTWKPYS